mmetsp:Transcript_12255/g.30048  ORF Transcript_12255/g.30048 Transcript_12255/m.30048 type:complete len:379 (+) Transcript_12255:238-1374(+)
MMGRGGMTSGLCDTSSVAKFCSWPSSQHSSVTMLWLMSNLASSLSAPICGGSSLTSFVFMSSTWMVLASCSISGGSEPILLPDRLSRCSGSAHTSGGTRVMRLLDRSSSRSLRRLRMSAGTDASWLPASSSFLSSTRPKMVGGSVSELRLLLRRSRCCSAAHWPISSGTSRSLRPYRSSLVSVRRLPISRGTLRICMLSRRSSSSSERSAVTNGGSESSFELRSDSFCRLIILARSGSSSRPALSRRSSSIMLARFATSSGSSRRRLKPACSTCRPFMLPSCDGRRASALCDTSSSFSDFHEPTSGGSADRLLLAITNTLRFARRPYSGGNDLSELFDRFRYVSDSMSAIATGSSSSWLWLRSSLVRRSLPIADVSGE